MTHDGRTSEAMARIDAALARIEAAAARGSAESDLEQRHAALRDKVSTTLSELDQLIEGLDR